MEAIRVNGNPLSPENIIVPGTSGHTEAIIQFVGKIQVKSGNSHITVGDNNTAVVAPNPDIDKTRWTLIGANGQAEVRIHLPRIWWRMDNAGDEASEWRDTAFEMSREEFRSNLEAVIIVRLPSVARKICVGFDSFNQYDGAREYSARHNKSDTTKQVKFKLREFCDHKQISEYSSRGSALQIKCGDAVCTLIRIPADAPPPKPKPEHSPMHKSPPGVCNSPQKGGFRPVTKNKRFSPAELSESGLSVAEAKRLKIAVDRRRKTKHYANIDRLKNLQQGGNRAN